MHGASELLRELRDDGMRTMVDDSIWDVRAADAAGVPTTIDPLLEFGDSRGVVEILNLK